MTIEPSLIVWTVLCFFALMLILKKLLFQPMLTFMDTRNAKIEAARKAKEDARTEYEAEARRLADERAAQEAQLRQSDAEALEQAQEELRRETTQKRVEAAQHVKVAFGEALVRIQRYDQVGERLAHRLHAKRRRTRRHLQLHARVPVVVCRHRASHRR